MANSESLSTKANTKLGLKDLKTVLNELISVKDKWYNLGLQLEVPMEELDTIETGCGSDQTTCLRKTLRKCLESGNADWRLLCEALCQQSVLGESAGLARILMEKYCQANDDQAKQSPPNEGQAKDGQDKEAQAKGSPANNREDDKSKGKKRKKSGDMPGPATKKQRTSMVDRKDGSDPEKPVQKQLDPQDFVRKQDDDQLCSTCKMVPYPPQRLKCCKQLYCEDCADELTECGECNQSAHLEKDQALYSKIQKKKIKCPDRSNGCIWKGTVSALKKHLPDCPETNDDEEGNKETQKTGQSSKTAEKSTQTPPARSVGMTPSLNLVMPDVRCSGEAWYSSAFLISDKIQHQLNLAVKLEEGSTYGKIKVSLALVPSKEGVSSANLENVGDCTVTIMNPVENDNHKEVKFTFSLINEDPMTFNHEIEIPQSYIHNDCLFFRVVKVDINETRSWLLDPMVPLKK